MKIFYLAFTFFLLLASSAQAAIRTDRDRLFDTRAVVQISGSSIYVSTDADSDSASKDALAAGGNVAIHCGTNLRLEGTRSEEKAVYSGTQPALKLTDTGDYSYPLSEDISNKVQYCRVVIGSFEALAVFSPALKAQEEYSAHRLQVQRALLSAVSSAVSYRAAQKDRPCFVCIRRSSTRLQRSLSRRGNKTVRIGSLPRLVEGLPAIITSRTNRCSVNMAMKFDLVTWKITRNVCSKTIVRNVNILDQNSPWA